MPSASSGIAHERDRAAGPGSLIGGEDRNSAVIGHDPSINTAATGWQSLRLAALYGRLQGLAIFPPSASTTIDRHIGTPGTVAGPRANAPVSAVRTMHALVSPSHFTRGR